MYLWMRLSSFGQSWASSSIVIQSNALPCGLRSSAMSLREETPDAVISSRIRRCLCLSVSPLQTGDKVNEEEWIECYGTISSCNFYQSEPSKNNPLHSPVGPGDGVGAGPRELLFSIRYRSQYARSSKASTSSSDAASLPPRVEKRFFPRS